MKIKKLKCICFTESPFSHNYKNLNLLSQQNIIFISWCSSLIFLTNVRFRFNNFYLKIFPKIKCYIYIIFFIYILLIYLHIYRIHTHKCRIREELVPQNLFLSYFLYPIYFTANNLVFKRKNKSFLKMLF